MGKDDDKVSILKVIWQYVFLWPSLRTYFVAWKSVKREKNEQKEKVVIIEE